MSIQYVEDNDQLNTRMDDYYQSKTHYDHLLHWLKNALFQEHDDLVRKHGAGEIHYDHLNWLNSGLQLI